MADSSYKRSMKDTIDQAKCHFCISITDDQLIKKFENFLLIANIFPYEKEHILLIPKRHVHSELDFNKEEIDELRNIHNSIIKKYYDLFNMCFYFTRENTPDQSMWHWHRHYVPTDSTLKTGIIRKEYTPVSIKF